jgi:tetratricopeptide (TPR) repeat protein
MSAPARPRWTAIMSGGVLAVVLLATLFVTTREDSAQKADELLRRAMLLSAEGDTIETEKIARQAIELDDSLSAAHRLAADCAVARNDFKQALNDLSQISKSDKADWISSRRLAADILHNQVFRFREAERAYQHVLAAVPDDIFANNGYARLLGLCGRRAEAIPCVLRLIRAGEETDLLILLSRESGALNDPDLLNAARQADPTDPNPLLGQAAIAASALKPRIALDKLNQAASLNGLPKDFYGRLGRQLLDNRQFHELTEWSRNLTAESMTAECWIVRAELAERSNDHRGAIRGYWEAVRLRPESLKATNQLARKLTVDGQQELAAPIAERVQQLNKFRDLQRIVIMSDEQPSDTDIADMVDAYRSVGRLWEAYAWGQLAMKNQPDNAALLQVMQSLPDTVLQLPLELTVRESNPAYQIDLSHYPIPSFHAESRSDQAVVTSDNISFRQQRSEVGFDFRYFDGTEGTTGRMFEFSGCGIAVVDIDNDKAPDLYCVQGRTWGMPLSESDGRSDRLFRNWNGERFEDVSEVANVVPEADFGQGVSVGDVNNDGFADIYVANIGPNRILLNNGDGTFSGDHQFQVSANGPNSELTRPAGQWTTSCLVADLNGDTFPDLYDVNYLTGDDLFDRVCVENHGGVSLCSPYDFEPALDRLWLGDGSGGFVADTAFLKPPPQGKGLGVVAMNCGNDRLSIFVSNDTVANFFYTALTPDAKTLSESAVSVGLAFNGEGKAEACMGIAVGDCTQDGRLDLLVTNFLYESNTLYSPLDEFTFEDRTRELGLHDATLPVLGWGTQFLDANLDGRLEAFVVNGYTQDLSKYGTPYSMRPQMFEWVGEGFHELPSSQLGAWSSAKAVGRTVTRLDWNLDGKVDLAVGLMDSPHFILTNTSRAADNGFLSLELVATDSARDAIGTTITATIGDSHFMHQLTAGDGYASSNERRLLIGCGPSAKIDRLSIAWPSGVTQQFTDVQVSRSVTAVEGRSSLADRQRLSR